MTLVIVTAVTVMVTTRLIVGSTTCSINVIILISNAATSFVSIIFHSDVLSIAEIFTEVILVNNKYSSIFSIFL